MGSMDRKQYLSIDSYKEAIEILDKVVTGILFSFAKHSAETKDVIISNFIARAIVSLKGIMQLWQMRDYQDCWVLLRCILDRVFHLLVLARDNTFELFEKWSFKERRDYVDKIRNDPDFMRKVDPNYFKKVDEQKQRYVAISREKPRWKRPKAKVVAREMGLMPLYKYGYDFASTYVHPMANDGHADFVRQTNLTEPELFLDQRLIIHDSCLSVAFLIQEGLSSSTLRWDNLLYHFLKDFFGFLENGVTDYRVSFVKISELIFSADLCEKTQ